MRLDLQVFVGTLFMEGLRVGVAEAKKPMAFETHAFELVSAIPLAAHREPMT